jgi:hypothetical protein
MEDYIMINVVESAYKVVVVEGKDNNLTVSEGDHLKFVTADGGEIVEGGLIKISGKKDKTKFQIIPTGAVKHEIWSLTDIAEGTIEIL